MYLLWLLLLSLSFSSPNFFHFFVVGEDFDPIPDDIDITAKVSSPFHYANYSMATYDVKEHARRVYADKHFRESLSKYGMAHISGAIPPELIRKTLYDVNKKISMMDKKFLCFDDPGVGKFSFNLASPLYLSIFDKSILPHLFRHLLGPMDRPYQTDTPQITIRFPGMFCEGPDSSKGWHIDGVGPLSNDNKTNPAKPGVHNFDSLIVILLSDSHGKFSGELGGYPQSHLRLAKWLNPERLHEWRVTGIDAFPNNEKSDEVLGDKPFHLLGKAGDVYILNYMIAHYAACNNSPYIRYNMYARVSGPTFPGPIPIYERHASLFDPLKNWRL